MKYLALDTSSSVASVSVGIDDTLAAEYTLNHGLTHSKYILPMIDEVLGKLNLTVDDLDFIAVACGPGSFTGLRIGVATAKGLAFRGNKPVVAVSCLEAMAYNYLHTDYVICPLMDARAGQVYTALYKRFNGKLKTLVPPTAIEIEKVIEFLKPYKKVLFMGDGVKPNMEKLKILGKKAVFGEYNNNMQRAASVALLGYKKALNNEFTDAGDLVPEYLRVSQAEREAALKNKKGEIK